MLNGEALLTRIRRTMAREHLAARGQRLLVALSGGADSVALLLIARELERGGDLVLAGAAHLNHQLRGADADEDERFCEALAARLGVRLLSDRVDVAALAEEQRRSVEVAAREARYAFLERAADACGADVIATAHTKDDQAETFLLRLLRGAGSRGLAGIRPRTGRIIRPLLDVERATLRDYLAAHGQAFREDASNADVSIPRNRVRHELLPLLESRFSPAVADVLAREAALARQDEEYLREEAIKLARRIVQENEAITIDAEGLIAAPRALGSRVARAALERFAGGRSITFDQVEWLLALAADKKGELSLPGQQARRDGQTIVLTPRTSVSRGASVSGDRNGFAFSLSIPGEVRLEPLGLIVGAEHLPGPAARHMRWEARGSEVGVAAEPVSLPLAVRSWRPGDRFRPLGAPGVRKLQDFFVDRKVPRAVRDTVPLVVDGRDRIVWVVGQSVAEEFRVTEPTQGVILLKVRHLGGPG
jgi:tRNA(Ile)-lysidine synthase